MRRFFQWWPWGSPSDYPTILVIDDFVPDPKIGAGAPRMAALLRALHAAGARITFWPKMDVALDRFTAEDTLPGIVIVRDRSETLGQFLASHRGVFDAMIVSRPHNMATVRALLAETPLLADGVTLIYDAEALFSVREIARMALFGRPLAADQAWRLIEDEMSLCNTADIVIAVNRSTAQIFVEAGGADVRVIGHAVDLRPSPRPFAERDGFLFVGPTYEDDTPNTDSVVWFVDHVLSGLRKGLGRDVSLVLAGHVGSRLIAAREETGQIRVAGVVADLTELYAGARVFVAPTRFAAGIPLKVYEAAARGVPIVLTPLLADMVGWAHEREALVAEKPEDFAAACARLHEDVDLWQTIRSNALARVERDCGRADFDRNVAHLVETIASRGVKARPPR